MSGALLTWRAIARRSEHAALIREAWRLRTLYRQMGQQTEANFHHFRIQCLLTEAPFSDPNEKCQRPS